VRTTDPVGTALASIAASSTTGAAAITLGALIVRHLQAPGPDALPPETGGTVVLVSAFVGIVAAAGTGWVLTGAIDDRWRRGVTAAVSVFGAVLASTVALPIDTLLGRNGLFGYFALLVLAAVYAHAVAHRNATK
jgi:hypothetical protein